MNSGDLCIVEFPFVACGISDGETISLTLDRGDVFILLDSLEIDELSVIEVQILFENKHMWFNIHRNDCIIDHVRRAESYDIPFMTLQEVEPGSNSPSLVKYNPHTY